MRASEFIDPAQHQVNAIKQQAKVAQKRAKEAALRLRLQKTQQQLAKATASQA
jgi:hypothetical protein